MSEIVVRNLCKTFEQKEGQVSALKDINLVIGSGKIFGIIGMSGAGKSTLVRCLNYLEVPTAGEVLIDGKELGSLGEWELRNLRSEVAMIFQHFNLLMQKNVLDNVCFPLLLRGVKKREARERARELLQIVGLEEKERAYPAQLSGGQKQRVAIARALASNPKVLLCDEATSALDPQTTASILSLLKDINQRYGITIVIITHQMSVIREICDEVGILDQGNLVEVGRVSTIFAHPKSKTAKELILRDLPDSEDDANMVSEYLESERTIRIVFSENSAFEPVLFNLIMQFKVPVNILRANTKNVAGTAKGDMLLSLSGDERVQREMIEYLRARGLEVEVTDDVDA